MEERQGGYRQKGRKGEKRDGVSFRHEGSLIPYTLAI